MQSNAERKLTDRDDVRHLLRRLAFAATESLESALTGLAVDEAVDVLVNGAKRAPRPVPPPFVLTEWTNTALLFTDTTAVEYQQAFAEQDAAAQADIERLRHWWLQEMVASEAPLRENLVLFLHGTLGSTTGSVNMPQALHARNDRLRRGCLGTVPALLESLATDPAMMIQIGMDDYREEDMFDEEFPNFRPGRLVLENWTVGSGAYAEEDVAELCRALTGWRLEAPSGYEPDRTVDPEGFRSQRRTGLRPVFEAAHSVDRPKTILGRRDTFDAASAIGYLARHPDTARRYSRLLLRYLGVEDPDRALERQLTATYRDTGGSLVALVREIAGSEAFWSPASRWALVKSPIHLAVGACRQLEVSRPPLVALGTWLAAAGQTLFQTPGFGDAGWPGQDAWIDPPERLAVRYQLGNVLATGALPDLGIVESEATGAARAAVDVGERYRRADPAVLLDRLDPAPGIHPAALTAPGIDLPALTGPGGATDAAARAREAIRRIVATPEYQLA
ncbi:MAG: DUF1800 family protein [Acidobacteria bacterium]|nr:DUF1800 family protein [Acidobacteriota bacterium]